MAKKKATTKSSTPTRRNKTAQSLARAVTRVTNPALLGQIAETSAKIDDLGFDDHGQAQVNTIDLAVAILNGRETRELVEWLMRATGDDEIATILGAVIAASRMAKRTLKHLGSSPASHYYAPKERLEVSG
jgi:hypothetical protein